MQQPPDEVRMRVAELAKRARGTRSRDRLVEGRSVSKQTLYELEGAKRFPTTAPKRQAIDEAYGWPVGSLSRIFDGEDPDVVLSSSIPAATPPERAAEIIDGLHRLVDELAGALGIEARDPRVRSRGR